MRFTLITLATLVSLLGTCLGSRSTVCEHRTMTLRCGGNRVLQITSAIYGRRDRTTCPRGPIKTTNCAAASSLRVLRGRCDRKRACSVRASNSVFGDPCIGTFKYLRVWYRCVVSTPTATVCEHQTMGLRCTNPSHVLYIISALYGRRDRTTCPRGPIKTTNCAARSSLNAVRRQCQGSRACTVRASNRVFGDPCVGTFKYLRVRYRCASPRRYYRTVCEHHTIWLGCSAGRRLTIFYALYGRRNRTTCRRGPIKTTRCAARSSFRVTRSKCQGRRVCYVQAKNSVFGDPCVGTYKYLRVGYFCS